MEGEGEDSAGEVEEIDGVVFNEAGEGEIAGEDLAARAPEDDFFGGGGLGGWRHG